jgi:hypothetical protein
MHIGFDTTKFSVAREYASFRLLICNSGVGGVKVLQQVVKLFTFDANIVVTIVSCIPSWLFSEALSFFWPDTHHLLTVSVTAPCASRTKNSC